MKTWTLSDEIRRDPALLRAVDGSRTLLDEVIGPTADLVDARWTVADRTPGQRRLVLNLADWTWPAGVEAEFSPADLAVPQQLRRKFHWLWGDLLQARSHEQIRQLREALVE